MPLRTRDAHYMRLALELAKKAQGETWPNPMVGAVVVRSGKIVGRGFHKKAGLPHAEAIALKQAGRLSRGATLYVTLEPCAHFGRTPPCARAIYAAGIRRVVAAMTDPNPKTLRRGLRWLKGRGIQTAVGVLEEESRRINRPFITRVTLQRPFVTVKVAQSLDGKIATKSGRSQWISSPQARRWAQRLRGRMDAILVGVETILKDDPRLTLRTSKVAPRTSKKQPLKVVLDSKLRTPPMARIFDSRTSVLIATTRAASRSREKKLRQSGAEVMRFPTKAGKTDLRALLRELSFREVTQLLIEGGGEVVASAFSAKAVDRIAFVVAPILIGGREAPTAFEGEGIASLHQAIRLRNVEVQTLGPDLLVTADV